MNDQKPPPSAKNPGELSPIRPAKPPTSPLAPETKPKTAPLPDEPAPKAPDTGVLAAEASTNPYMALKLLLHKMARVKEEYKNGKLNPAQYEALTQRYNEQHTIIQRLIERDPEGKAWKQVLGTQGHTGFLRQHFEAQAIYFVVYHHELKARIYASGRRKPDEALIKPVLKQLWGLPTRPKSGIGRKPLGEDQWLIMVVGEVTVTVIHFTLEPSAEQIQLARDLHADFERANAAALTRGAIVPERMVFPQRALVENR